MSSAVAEKPGKPVVVPEVLLSKSKVRLFAKGSLSFRFSGDAFDALNQKVKEILALAAASAKENKRATIKATDINAIVSSIPSDEEEPTQ